MSLETNGIRSQLVHHFNAASDYAGGCTQHQREDAHYERGRKDGLGVALKLFDTFLSSENGEPGRRPGTEEGRRGERVAHGAGSSGSWSLGLRFDLRQIAAPPYRANKPSTSSPAAPAPNALAVVKASAIALARPTAKEMEELTRDEIRTLT